MDISIIIVNYNTFEYVKTNVEHIKKYSQGITYEIIIVDNNSTDKNALSDYAAQNPDLKIIFSKKNNGFGAGCNIGVKNSIGHYLLFLNPDIQIDSNVLKNLYDTYQTLQSPGALSGIQIDETGKPIYTYNKFSDLSWEIKEAFGFGINKQIKKLLQNVNEGKVFQVDWVIGACIFISKEKFLKINGFDEDFFLYYEDTDLQKRLSEEGLKSFVDPSIKLLHHTKSSVGSESGKSIYNMQMNKNRLIYYKKHSGFLNYNFIRVMYFSGYLLRYFKFLISSNKKSLNYSSSDIKNILKFYINPKLSI